MFVKSRKIPNQIEVIGFEQLDQSAHMMAWLRKGNDFRKFITHDLEDELYAQDRDSQLLSMHFESQPSFETRLRKEKSDAQAVVTHFSVTLPISLRVKASNGVIWVLNVNYNYQAENMNLPGQFQLRLNFTIVGSQAEA
ncbi:hypothetical protein [Xanthomonas axonopodis]|uniref:hypothetical protein n=1 Tax=Xanthomonas axonopodis TaxID=53413 RepID=UPI0011161BEA|nr:hypothetical protein [Xanthomonas axonopodis]